MHNFHAKILHNSHLHTMSANYIGNYFKLVPMHVKLAE